MAKAKMDPTITSGVVLNGVLYVQKPMKSTVMQKANNNRSNRAPGTVPSQTESSAQFRNLDQNITAADAKFDQLPNQAAWEAAAAARTGTWSLCANCEPDTGGKKLFRQWTLNRSALGLSQSTDPADLTTGPSLASWFCNYVWQPALHAPWGSASFDPAAPDFCAIAQVGLVGQNPSTKFTQADNNVEIFSGPVYDWCKKTIETLFGPRTSPYGDVLPLKICTCAPDGTPGLSVTGLAEYVFDI